VQRFISYRVHKLFALSPNAEESEKPDPVMADNGLREKTKVSLTVGRGALTLSPSIVVRKPDGPRLTSPT